MSQAYLQAIEAIKADIADKEAKIKPLREQLAAHETALTPLKSAANQLCKLAGIAELYAIGDDGAPAPGSQPRFRKDQFFNKDLGDAVVEYLTARKEASGEPSPATVAEIYEGLTKHGYKFEGESDTNNKRALKVSLVRNTTYLAKVSDDLFGLRKWYNLRASRKGATETEAETPAADAPAEPAPAAT